MFSSHNIGRRKASEEYILHKPQKPPFLFLSRLAFQQLYSKHGYKTVKPISTPHWVLSRPENALRQHRLDELCLDSVPAPKSLVNIDILYFDGIIQVVTKLLWRFPGDCLVTAIAALTPVIRKSRARPPLVPT
jgi:hypothetical protein